MSVEAKMCNVSRSYKTTRNFIILSNKVKTYNQPLTPQTSTKLLQITPASNLSYFEVQDKQSNDNDRDTITVLKNSTVTNFD